MKRLIASGAAAAGLAFGLTAGLVAAGGPAGASLRPHVTAPTEALSQSANLVAGKVLTVTGSGWHSGDLVFVAECNSDGGFGTAYGTHACSATTSNVSSTGKISLTYTVKTGKMVAGYATTPPLSNDCAPTQTQTHHGIPCIIGISDFSTHQSTFLPIFFQAPTPTVKSVKGSIVNGVQLYNTTFTEAGAYAPTSVANVNKGGYEVIGTYKPATGPVVVGKCQGTTSPGVTWGVNNLKACNGVLGEVVTIKSGTTLLKSFKVSTGGTTAGDFVTTVKGLKKGTYTFTLKGTTSGTKSVLKSIVVG